MHPTITSCSCRCYMVSKVPSRTSLASSRSDPKRFSRARRGYSAVTLRSATIPPLKSYSSQAVNLRASPLMKGFKDSRIRLVLWLSVLLPLAFFSSSHGAEFKANVTVAAFGLYGDQSVFENEVKGAAQIVGDRFGASSVITRANTKRNEDASLEMIATTLQTASKKMDIQNDILFLILTSHGSQAGLEVKAGIRDETLSPLNLVTLLNDTRVRHRIVVISACYSGVFIRPLADPDTLIITAADADHSSFGCKNGNEWTYFGDAFFNTALRRAPTLRDAFVLATSLIRKRERQRGLTPSNPQMAGGENIGHLLKGEVDSVAAYSGEGTGFFPKYAFSRGFAYGAKGDNDHAIVEYSEAIRFDPKDPIAYNNRGAAYSAKGDYDHAIADYTEAIRLNPKVASAYINRGRAYRAKGEIDHAITDYNTAIKLDPEFAVAYNNRGLAYGAKGDNDHAIADYTKAIRLDSKLASAYDNRGRAYRAKGENERAAHDFKEAIRLDSSHAPALKALGMEP
jgi:tetratricopeptide (TPR) repeat protein